MEIAQGDTVEELRHQLLKQEISHLRTSNEKDLKLVWQAVDAMRTLIEGIEKDRNKLIGALVVISFVLSIASGLIINYITRAYF